MWHACAYILCASELILPIMLQMAARHPCMLSMQDMKHGVCDEEVHDWQWLGAHAIPCQLQKLLAMQQASSVNNHLYKCIWLCSNVAAVTASAQSPTTAYADDLSNAHLPHCSNELGGSAAHAISASIS